MVLSEPLPSLDQRSAGAVIERDVARVPVLTQIVSGQDVVHGVTQRHLENGDVGQDRGSRVAIPNVQIEDVTTRSCRSPLVCGEPIGRDRAFQSGTLGRRRDHSPNPRHDRYDRR